MKVTYIEMSGFRGFRDSTRFEVPSGFAVVTGRNGVGKSTVCDALEFALTGTIRGASEHKETGETIDDYIWWRGAGPVTDFYVEVGFRRPDGSEIAVRRSPAAFSTKPDTKLNDVFLEAGATLDNPMVRLCRTTIIRDEEITQLSVDLGETERFDFVRAALGTADFSTANDKAKRVGDVLKRQLDAAQRDYDLQRDRVADLTARLSQARSDAARVSGLSDAENVLAAYLPEPPADPVLRLSLAENAIAGERVRLDALTRNFARLSELVRMQSEVATPKYRSQLRELESVLSAAQADAASAKALANRLGNELAKSQQESPRLGSLAQLHEHGRRLGLQNGECPLCGIKQDEAQFEAHLGEIGRRLESTDAQIAELSRQRADAVESAARLATKAGELALQLEGMRQAESVVESEFAKLSHDLAQLGFTATTIPETTLRSLSEHIEKSRVRTSRAEEALAVLRASHATARVLEYERESSAAHERLVSAEKLLSRLSAAHSRAKEAQQTIRRVQGEFVDEQLAEVSPLLEELYQRLRPHVDWQSVRYNLRGDVRRMLSLVVGPDLNPSFVFSSGQRRAAGLAFLLAIHLSRRWCKLQTLVLDDPVQHVDDYRALHLTELLAAIRRNGRQIICTVEDQALAELLARRLRSDVGDEGALVELSYQAGRGARVAERRLVAPLSQKVLVAS